MVVVLTAVVTADLEVGAEEELHPAARKATTTINPVPPAIGPPKWAYSHPKLDIGRPTPSADITIKRIPELHEPDWAGACPQSDGYFPGHVRLAA